MAAGHAIRCLSLAAGFKKLHNQVVLICENNEILNNTIIKYKISHQEVTSSPLNLDDAQLIINQEPDLVVVDSPNVTQKWVDCFDKKIPVFYLWSPSNNKEICADLVIFPEVCQNTRATDSLCGFDYVLLAPPYWNTRLKKHKGDMTNILITTGGSDHYDISSLVVKALDYVFEFPLNIIIVIGPFFNESKVLSDLILNSRHDINLEYSPPSLHDLLKESDFVISGGGGTLFEMSRLGIPGIGIEIWSEQSALVAQMHNKGVIRKVKYNGFKDTLDSMIALLITFKGNRQLLSAMSAKGRKLIDGQGALRMAGVILNKVIKQ